MKRYFALILIFIISGIAPVLAQKPASIQYISPVHESNLNSRSSQIIIRPGEKLEPVSAYQEDLITVIGSKSGEAAGQVVLSSDGATLIFKPDARFSPAEEVVVTLHPGLRTRSGDAVPSFSFAFQVTPLEEPLNPYAYVAELNPKHFAEKIAEQSRPIAQDDPLPDAYGFELVHYGDPSPGCFFLAPTHVTDLEGYNLIVDNDGNLVYSEHVDTGMPVELKVAPSGWLTYGKMYEESPFGVAAGLTEYYIMDSTYSIVETIQMGNGYIADFHEFQILANGHVLMLGYDIQQVDMSEIVEGGYPGAMVVGSIVQELDNPVAATGQERNVIFQWRSWDHYELTDSYQDLTQSTVNPIHLNSIEMSNDGHLIISSIGLGEVTKINRRTGEIIWRMGGKNNEFTFINEDQANDPVYFMFQHDVRQLDNGNLTMIDNGNNNPNVGGGDVPVRPYTRAVEYELDETAMTATRVWEYRHDPDIFVGNFGSVQRLDNGNTVIGWGAASMTGSPAITEVDASGTVISELSFDRLLLASYRAYRFDWNRRRPAAYVWSDGGGSGLLRDNYYKFNLGDDTTGVMFQFTDGVALSTYNQFHVWRYENGPVAPEWPGKAPKVLPVTIETVNLTSDFPAPFTGTIFFDQNYYQFEHPDSVVVYFTATPGSGIIMPVPTTYSYVDPNPNFDDPEIDGWYVSAPVTNHGHYFVTYPDLPSTALPPYLVSPVNGEQVDQTHPVMLEWTPVGLVSWYHLQVATDDQFSNIVVDENYLNDAVYEWENPGSNTPYYWRVNASNTEYDYSTITSDWSSSTFATTDPFITVIAPNGGEQWQQNRTYFVQWDDVIEDSVEIELFRDGALLQSIATTESDGYYTWTIPGNLALGSNYQISIKSAENGSIVDMSDANFSIVEFSDVDTDPSMKELDFALVQNYPNPFNAKTQIRYSIPERTHVSLKLYDIMGHEVKTLVDGVQNPNRYTVHLDANDLPTGVYFYRLRSGENRILTRKLVLTK